MNKERLKQLYPRGSRSFFEANENNPDPRLQDPKPKQNKTPTLGNLATREEKSVGRVTVRYRLCRVRPLDPDAVQGSTKDITDGLCRCGLIPGDDPYQIILLVKQEKVEHYADERTIVELIYDEPDGTDGANDVNGSGST